MPHLSIEYSGNLDGEIDLAALCGRLKSAMLETGLFEEGAIRVRAHRCDAWAVADGDPRNGFLDAVLRIGAGRAAAAKRDAGERLFAELRAACAARLASPYFALSLEIREIDAALSWKENAIHPRLRKP